MGDTDKRFEERMKFLKRFCKEYGVYKSFFKNAKERSSDTESFVMRNYGGSWINLVKKSESMISIIDYSFIWKNTLEGHSFWSDINFKFNRYYNDKNCKL